MKQRNDRVISKKNMIMYIQKHIMVVIICMILGAVGLTGVFYIKNIQEGKQEQNDISLGELYDGFSDEEKADVSYALYCYNRQKDIEQYIDQSLLMKIEPQHMTLVTSQYEVELVDEDKYTEEEKLRLIQEIIIAYSVYVRDGGLSSRIASDEKLINKYSSRQLEELIEFGYDGSVETMSTFCLYLYGTDIVPELDNDYKSILEEYGVGNGNLAKHRLKEINHLTNIVRSDTIYNNQKNMYSERLTSKDKMKQATSSLSGDTLRYYNEMTSLEDQNTNEDNIQTEVIEMSQSVSAKQILKYGGVGAVIGFLGAIMILVFCYIFSPTIISDMDYTATMGIKLLGKIPEKNILESISFITAKIKMACRKDTIEKLAIISSDFDNIDEEIKMQLEKALETQGVQALFIPDVLKDCENMNQLFEIGSCMMIEKFGVSKYNSVYDLAAMCNENEVNIIGVAEIVK